MKASTYNRITTVCVIVAGASAVASDAASGYAWIFHLVAGLAAIVSFGFYLAQRRSSDGCAINAPVTERVVSEVKARASGKASSGGNRLRGNRLQGVVPSIRGWLFGESD